MVYIQIHKIRNIDENTEFYTVINVITQINLSQTYDGVIAKMISIPENAQAKLTIDDNILKGIKAYKKEELEFKLKELNNPKTLGDMLLFKLLKDGNRTLDNNNIIVESIMSKVNNMSFEQLYDSSITKLIADEVIPERDMRGISTVSMKENIELNNVTKDKFEDVIEIPKEESENDGLLSSTLKMFGGSDRKNKVVK
jgi:transcriptional regulator CtsR